MHPGTREQWVMVACAETTRIAAYQPGLRASAISSRPQVVIDRVSAGGASWPHFTGF